MIKYLNITKPFHFNNINLTDQFYTTVASGFGARPFLKKAFFVSSDLVPVF